MGGGGVDGQILLILWCQGRGLEQEIGNVKTWGGWGC